MRPALILIDLQRDFLDSPGLRPAAGALVAQLATLLDAIRHAGLPVLHVWTSVRQDPDERMPHWRRAGRWSCVRGSAGHSAPAELVPRAGEPVFHKVGFSPFVDPAFSAQLSELNVDTLLLAGVHTHACVRATALDAYQRGFRVNIVADGVASYDELHAQISARYLEARAMPLVSVEGVLRELRTAEPVAHAPGPTIPAATIDGAAVPGDPRRWLEHVAPAQRDRSLWQLACAGNEAVERAVESSSEAQREWARTYRAERRTWIEALRARVVGARAALVQQLALEVGKPVVEGEAEVELALSFLDALLARGEAPASKERGPGWTRRRAPLGVVALITPFNNPLAVPLGKLAPALWFGNAVVWKPAPAGSGVARALLGLLTELPGPAGLVNAVMGDRETACSLMEHSGVAAVSLTGSFAAGASAQAACARRATPLQAELGGNNAAIVWDDTDLERAAAEIAAGAFGGAGQRCTANRRVIVSASCADEFVRVLEQETAGLAWGDPLDPGTRVGPLISDSARQRVVEVIARARAEGCQIRSPHAGGALARELTGRGAYVPPTIVECGRPQAEIVQEETFGPVVVVQRAAGWEQALQLCDGVDHGLIASLFSRSPERRRQFLERVRAGVLKLDQTTAGVAADAPFGGWKRSAIGPPEHGSGDRAFYTRGQTIYGAAAAAAVDEEEA